MRSFPLLFPFALFIFFLGLNGFSQVKIGENPHEIDVASILELESTERALVLTRVTDAEMQNIFPLNGALVYNTEARCIFVFEGSVWKSLCNSEIQVTTSTLAPTNNQVGDVWIDTNDNNVGIWNGTDFVTVSTNPKNGDGPPSPSTADNALAGDIYVDTTNGNLYTYTGTEWIDQNRSIQVGNGLVISNDDNIELGGILTRPTIIETNATNTLALEGLETAENNPMAVTIDETTGILNRTPISSFVQKEEIVIMANDGQNQFSTPAVITNSQKIDVYRNGVKIDFIAIDGNTIELETDIICYQNDEIRIVQFF